MASINSAEVIFYSKRKDISRKVELIKGRFWKRKARKATSFRGENIVKCEKSLDGDEKKQRRKTPIRCMSWFLFERGWNVWQFRIQNVRTRQKHNFKRHNSFKYTLIWTIDWKKSKKKMNR
jgi:hypothetical protein